MDSITITSICLAVLSFLIFVMASRAGGQLSKLQEAASLLAWSLLGLASIATCFYHMCYLNSAHSSGDSVFHIAVFAVEVALLSVPVLAKFWARWWPEEFV